MADKRRLKRRHLIYYLSVFDRISGRLVGQLVDITTKGIMLSSEETIEENKLFHLRMVLPDIIEGNNQIWFDAESVWCKRDINPNFYDIGFKFIDISPKAATIIQNLIDDFSFHD